MQRRVLEVAAEISGGIPELCKRLECSEDELRKWLDDREVCPLPQYLKAAKFREEFQRHIDEGGCPFGGESSIAGVRAPSDTHVYTHLPLVPA